MALDAEFFFCIKQTLADHGSMRIMAFVALLESFHIMLVIREIFVAVLAVFRAGKAKDLLAVLFSHLVAFFAFELKNGALGFEGAVVAVGFGHCLVLGGDFLELIVHSVNGQDSVTGRKHRDLRDKNIFILKIFDGFTFFETIKMGFIVLPAVIKLSDIHSQIFDFLTVQSDGWCRSFSINHPNDNEGLILNIAIPYRGIDQFVFGRNVEVIYLLK